jgi:hypothetical protein
LSYFDKKKLQNEKYLDLKELLLNSENILKVIKSLIDSAMYYKKYDVILFVLKKYILDLKTQDLIPFILLLLVSFKDDTFNNEFKL